MTFTALYHGTCNECLEPVVPGQEATYNLRDDLVHLECPEPADDRPKSPLCGRCFTYHFGEC